MFYVEPNPNILNFSKFIFKLLINIIAKNSKIKKAITIEINNFLLSLLNNSFLILNFVFSNKLLVLTKVIKIKNNSGEITNLQYLLKYYLNLSFVILTYLLYIQNNKIQIL